MTTLVGLASWVLGGGVVELLWSMGSFLQPLLWMGGALPLMALTAGALFGLANQSKKMAFRGAVAGFVGMIVAPVATIIRYPVIGALGGAVDDIAFLLLLSLFFCPIYGIAIFGWKAGWIFALVGVLVAIPFALLQPILMTGGGGMRLLVWGFTAVTVGVAIGLATGIHRTMDEV